MNPLNINDVVHQYVEENIGNFHLKRLKCIESLKLYSVLSRKNPYLFKTKYILTSEHLIRSVVDAHISSNEETIFGDWLEGLAIFINHKVFAGWKSGIPGIDLEFDKDSIRYIVSIKSGPKWGNSRQVNKMIGDFKTAIKSLRTSNSSFQIVAVNGCCYGKDRRPDKGDYFKFCGQRFWNFLSGDDELFTEIIEPLGHQAKAKNEEFMQSYAQKINKFTLQFNQEFCDKQGNIDWRKIVILNSSQ